MSPGRQKQGDPLPAGSTEPDPELRRLWSAPVGKGGEAPGGGTPRSLVAECTDDVHPTLQGRIRVRWTGGAGTEQESWVPALANLAVRRGDRVLLIMAENWPEPLAVGVVDGFAARPEIRRQPAAVIAVKSDETVRVQDSNGQDVLEVSSSQAGPVVRLLQKDLNIELPGAFRLKADSVDLTARSGQVKIEASDDVVVKGELVRLN